MRENVGEVDVLDGENVRRRDIFISWNVDNKGILKGKNVDCWQVRPSKMLADDGGMIDELQRTKMLTGDRLRRSKVLADRRLDGQKY